MIKLKNTCHISKTHVKSSYALKEFYGHTGKCNQGLKHTKLNQGNDASRAFDTIKMKHW